MVESPGANPGGAPPDPRQARTVDEFVAYLAATRVWAGAPSLRTLARQATEVRRRRLQTVAGEVVRPVLHSTVHNLFSKTIGRSYLDHDLVFDLLIAMGLSPEQRAWWRQAWTTVFAGRNPADAVTVDTHLPDDLREFTGRADELDRMLAQATTAATAAVFSIEGMAGVGKTQLAVRAAHELLRRGTCRDTQLHVNLRGFDPRGRPPADPAAVLEGLIRRLGWSGQLPANHDARICAYHTLLRGRSVVILLDNVATKDQIRDLLPDSPNAVVIITSRNRLAGLPGATTLALDVLSDGEAVELLTRTIGREQPNLDRADPDRAAVARIAQLCGNLPLALAVTAAHLRGHPEIPLADHAEHRAELGLQDEVQVSLTLSYDGLGEQHQRLFRLLSLHPGNDLEPYACAALIDGNLQATRRALAGLADRCLLTLGGPPGHYHVHDLVRTYAADQAKRIDLPQARRASLARLLDFYRYGAARAMDTIAPYEKHRRPRVDGPAMPVPALDDDTTTLAWLDAQRANLVAVIARATASQQSRHAIDLAQILFRYFVIGGHTTDAFAAHGCALRSARREHNNPDEASALLNLGVSYWQLGQADNAAEHLLQALDTFTQLGDRTNAGRVHNNLGLVRQWQGRHTEAHVHHQLALTEFRAVGEELGIGAALGNLAIIYWNWGQYDNALQHFDTEVAICRKLGDHDGVAIGLGNLGNVYERLGDYDRAQTLHLQALDMHHATGNRAGQASTLTNLGSVHAQMGSYHTALEYHRRAHAIFVDLGDDDRIVETQADIIINLARTGLTKQAGSDLDQALTTHRPTDNVGPGILNRFAEALRLTGRDEQAMQWYRAALARAHESRNRYHCARARDGLAHALAAANRIDEARYEWHRALETYRDLGVPDAAQVQAQLTSQSMAPPANLQR